MHCCIGKSIKKFLNSCLKAGLRIIAVLQALASLTEERESTGFRGYNERYFFDKGVCVKLAHPKIGKLLLLLILFRHKSFREELSLLECIKISFKGFDYFENGFGTGEGLVKR